MLHLLCLTLFSWNNKKTLQMNLTDNEIKKRKVKKYFDDEGRKKFAHKTDIQKEMEIKKP